MQRLLFGHKILDLSFEGHPAEYEPVGAFFANI
jgi:hypothetical protein